MYGRAAPFDALVHVADAADDVVLDALRSLTASGVVYEVADDQFWFTHALVADAIEHHLLGRERRRLHERSFEAVRAAPMLDHAVPRPARHRRRPLRRGAGDRPPGRARATSRRARRSRRCASPPTPSARRPNDPELLAVATEAAWRLDFIGEALGTAQRWERVAVEPAERIEAMRFVARLHWEAGDREASVAARDALESLRRVARHARSCAGRRGPASPSCTCSPTTPTRRWRGPSWRSADAESIGDEHTAARARVEAASAMAGAAAADRGDGGDGRRRSSTPGASATRCCCAGRSTTASSWSRRTRRSGAPGGRR